MRGGRFAVPPQSKAGPGIKVGPGALRDEETERTPCGEAVVQVEGIQ